MYTVRDTARACFVGPAALYAHGLYRVLAVCAQSNAAQCHLLGIPEGWVGLSCAAVARSSCRFLVAYYCIEKAAGQPFEHNHVSLATSCVGSCHAAVWQGVQPFDMVFWLSRLYCICSSSSSMVARWVASISLYCVVGHT